MASARTSFPLPLIRAVVGSRFTIQQVFTGFIYTVPGRRRGPRAHLLGNQRTHGSSSALCPQPGPPGGITPTLILRLWKQGWEAPGPPHSLRWVSKPLKTYLDSSSIFSNPWKSRTHSQQRYFQTIHGDSCNLTPSSQFFMSCRCDTPSKTVPKLFLIHCLMKSVT